MKVRTLYRGLFSQSVCVVLAVTIAASLPLQAWAQEGSITAPSPVADQKQPTDQQGELRPRVGGDKTLLAGPDVGKLDLSYVSPQAVVVATIRPWQLLTSPALALAPVEVVSAAGREYLGTDPIDAEQVTLFTELPLGGPPNYGIVVKFGRQYDVKSIPERLRAHTKPGKIDGRDYLESTQPMLPSIYAPDDRMLVIAPDLMLRRLINPTPGAAPGRLIERIRNVPVGDDLYLACDLAAFHPLIALGLSQVKDVPPEAKPYLDMPNLIDSADFSFNLTHDAPSQLLVHANDDASAEKLLQQVKTASDLWQDKFTEQMRAEVAKSPEMQGPIGEAYLKYLDRVRHAPPMWHLERAGSDISLFSFRPGNTPQQQLVLVAVVGVLVALLLPAIQAAREAARRTQSMNNMKQLMLSLLNYHDAKKTLPANAIYSSDGKPLLSWRVAILPYLEEDTLYKEFHLDEPWDSPHNKPLVLRMPEVFKNSGFDLGSGRTNYLAAVGEHCVFDGSDKGTKLRQITDGLSQTIVLLEADSDQAAEWTKPQDWNYVTDHPTSGLGHLRPGGWLTALADGEVLFISNEIDAQQLKAMFTKDGHESH
jgi:type II secretory pathway pseudopilin PulG